MVREDAGHFVSLADWAQNPAQPGLAHEEEGLGRRWGGKNPVVEVSTSAHFRKRWTRQCLGVIVLAAGDQSQQLGMEHSCFYIDL